MFKLKINIFLKKVTRERIFEVILKDFLTNICSFEKHFFMYFLFKVYISLFNETKLSWIRFKIIF